MKQKVGEQGNEGRQISGKDKDFVKTNILFRTCFHFYHVTKSRTKKMLLPFSDKTYTQKFSIANPDKMAESDWVVTIGLVVHFLLHWSPNLLEKNNI